MRTPGDRLGERAGEHDALRCELVHRREQLAAEANLAVRIVLEDQEVVLLGEGDELLALLERERAAAGVLVVRDDVRERRAQATLEGGAQGGDVDAVVLERDRGDLGAALLEAEQGAVVAGLLDDHLRARRDELVEQERVGLHRAVRDDHVLGRDAVLLREVLAQRHVPDGGAVGRRARRIVRERPVGGSAEALDVDDVDGRRAAGEGDRVSHSVRA